MTTRGDGDPLFVREFRSSWLALAPSVRINLLPGVWIRW